MTAGRRDARAIGLRYVSPDTPGIRRRKAGRGFRYESPGGAAVRDEATLSRIRALAIPPAWSEVWICPEPDGHLQAVGRDARGRRQYRYHARFRARRDRGKFARLARFGERLPRIRRRVAADLRRPGLPREKVLAAVLALLETTRFRVGNAEYARLNRSFGLSTLRNRHAEVSGTKVRFRFRGKGGRVEEATLVDRRLAGLVRRCQDLPGQELFQYEDDDGQPQPISSEDVNDYLREAAGSDEFSAKDFRTWTATVLAHRALRHALAGGDTDAAATGGLPKRIVADALQQVAEAIGDTVTVTRTSYVHPAVLATPVDAPAEGGRAPGTLQEARGRAVRAAPIERADELAVLRVLAATATATAASAPTSAPAPNGTSRKARRPARRSQVGGASATRRSRRSAA